MIVFYRHGFARGVIKVRDIKMKDGKKVLDDDGNETFVYWKFSPEMNGMMFQPNSKEYVMREYPMMFWEEADFDRMMEEIKQKPPAEKPKTKWERFKERLGF